MAAQYRTQGHSFTFHFTALRAGLGGGVLLQPIIVVTVVTRSWQHISHTDSEDNN